MKGFILYIFSFLFLFLVLLELTTRIFDLSNHTILEVNLDNDRLCSPQTEGAWVKGGMREIYSHYKINNQGFNSIKDYSTVDRNKISIALIGDSFIEGFHVDVESSIGRILEREMNDSVEVHEYGRSGGNIVDFSLMFEKFCKGRYDYTFILASGIDLVDLESCVMEKGNTIPKESSLRKIYDNLYFIRYLNINQGIGVKLRKLITMSKDIKPLEEKVGSEELNTHALNRLDSTCVIIYEADRLDPDLLSNYKNLPLVKIEHLFTPINFGFEKHWNLNGRRNCALSIKRYLEH